MTFRRFLKEKYGSVEEASVKLEMTRQSLYNYIKDPGTMKIKTFTLICHQTNTSMADMLLILIKQDPNKI